MRGIYNTFITIVFECNLHKGSEEFKLYMSVRLKLFVATINGEYIVRMRRRLFFFKEMSENPLIRHLDLSH